MANRTVDTTGLGNVGAWVAKVGLASDRNFNAWGQNLTSDVASAGGPIRRAVDR